MLGTARKEPDFLFCEIATIPLFHKLEQNQNILKLPAKPYYNKTFYSDLYFLKILMFKTIYKI